jgi:hypothetical protein
MIELHLETRKKQNNGVADDKVSNGTGGHFE